MIRNDRQYRITQAEIRRFETALADLKGQRRPSTVSPRLWAAQRDAAASQLADLRKQVREYESLRGSVELDLAGVEDLPRTLIRARIARGLTQESLAKRLGMKEQQIQRYEATEYASASFARIREVVDALGLRLRGARVELS